MSSYWFGDVTDKEGRCSIPAAGDKELLIARLNAIRAKPGPFDPFTWHIAVRCGAVRDRTEYIARLREICITDAERRIREIYTQKDAELLPMVRMLDEMDSVVNVLSERAAEWHQVRNPTFSRKYRKTPAHILVRTMREKSRGALGRVAGRIEDLAAARTDLAKEVSARANEVMPNTSALIGGLVAARLLSQAGGLRELSRLPASGIQVLGAKTALFAHLLTHSPSPKHGIIFQHRRVHNAGKLVRGRVARVLAGKLAIAAKIDYYRGEMDPVFLENAQKHIDTAGGESASALDR